MCVCGIINIETISDVNISLDYLYNVLNCALSKHTQLQTKRVKRIRQPDWYNDINNGIKDSRTIRDTLNNKTIGLNTKDGEKSNKLTKKSKRLYFSNKAKKESKHIWKI